jgi:hypothetical protein
MMPRDETVNAFEEEDPFAFADSDNEKGEEKATDAGGGSVADSTEFAGNPGKEMCHHVISTEGYSGSGEESVERDETESCTGPMQGCEPDPDPEGLLDEHSVVDMTVDEQDEIPVACSTPLRGATEFRIVTIQPPAAMPGRSGGEITQKNHDSEKGDENSAVGDENSAGSRGDALTAASGSNTAEKTPDKFQEKRSNSGTAKVPSIVQPPKPVKKKTQEVEVDAVPTQTYKSILAAKINKITPPTIPGTGAASANTDCGSFYNTGDNRIRRSVYKENVATLTVSSLSFNPVTWECASCPTKHDILGGEGASRGGEGGGGGRTVIVMIDQNFPAVLPTATGHCLAIMRIEHGSLRNLSDMLLSIAPTRMPEGTIFLLGSLTQLKSEGL